MKCCRAKGIPIIEMVKITPQKIWLKQITKPPVSSQRILNSVKRHPDEFSLTLVSRPNGYKANPAIFRVCIPNGIPIIDTISRMLAMKYSRAIKIPPKISQMIFPNRFISILFFYVTQYRY